MAGYYDIHSHYIPQVDDGADNLRVAQEMLQLAMKEGIGTIIATPHYRDPYFMTSAKKREENFQRLKEVAENMNIPIKLYLGNEVHYHEDMVQWLKEGTAHTMAGSSYVLTEFSMSETYTRIRSGIYELVSSGYQPILAHAERCEKLLGHADRIEELIQLGAHIQLNAGSFTGESGYRAKLFCKSLMKKNLIHFIGSDAHNVTDRPPQLKKCAEILSKKMGAEYANRILRSNPAKILQNEEVL